MAHGMKPNARLWRHICWRQYVNFKLLNLPIFLYRFWKNYSREVESWKKFFQYLKYELRYDILNLDKFGAQKRESRLVNQTKLKSFIVESPLLFNLHITHRYYCWKLREKEIWKTEIPNCEKNLENSIVAS